MKKTIAVFVLALTLFITSFLYFNRAYSEMRRYSTLTNQSLLVFSDFQELSKLINKAAIIHPTLLKENNSSIFFVDSTILVDHLDQLRRDVRDSVNKRLADELVQLLQSEIPWLLRSNVTDSILSGKASDHILNLEKIDSLHKAGIRRTRFLFRYRNEKLEEFISLVKIRIVILLLAGTVLLVYIAISLLSQNKKRKAHEDALLHQEQQFRAMVENNQDLIMIIDRDQNVLYSCPSTERITGFSSEELRNNKNYPEIHPRDREKAKQHFQEAISEPGKIISVNYRIKHKDGRYIHLEGSYSSLLQHPALNGIIVNMKDITEQKLSEHEAISSEKRYRQTLENMIEGIQIIGFDWKYIYVNESLTKYSNYKSGDMSCKKTSGNYPTINMLSTRPAL